MKVLFAGPSLYGFDFSAACTGGDTIDCRGPAAQGDIARAVVEGATAIGLIDGRYEDVAAPWHKEILYALEQGVQVFGAASMGALRAAECAEFGMIGIGAVFERYRSGELTDDAAVAQVHGPAELGYLPLSEALVNVEATFERFRKLKAVTEAEAERLDASARALFFKERTYPRILPRRAREGRARQAARRADQALQGRREARGCADPLRLSRLSRADPAGGARRLAPAVDYTWQLTLERAQKFAEANSRSSDSIAA